MPRPFFTNSARPSCSSSLRMCIDTADWVLWTRSAARVNEPVSTMAMNERSWSVSSIVYLSPKPMDHIINIR